MYINANIYIHDNILCVYIIEAQRRATAPRTHGPRAAPPKPVLHLEAYHVTPMALITPTTPHAALTSMAVTIVKTLIL